MTFAQFRRLKPKYQLRIVLVCVVALLLFVGILLALSAGINLVRRQLNTSTLKDVTASNVFDRATLSKIETAVNQKDAARLLVLDSSLTMRSGGGIIEAELNFVNIRGKDSTEYWRVRANEEKATLAKVDTKYENMNALSLRKQRLAHYYPTLGRVGSSALLQYLADNAPVTTGGLYTFTENFGDNLSPELDAHLYEADTPPEIQPEGRLPGVWVSLNGVSPIAAGYQPVTSFVPTVLSVHAPNPAKSKGERIVLSPPVDTLVVLLEVEK